MPKSASTKTTKTAAPEPDADEPETEPVVEIPFGGHTFTVPKNRDDWNTRAIIAFGSATTYDDQIEGIRLQLGEDEWSLLVDTVAPTAGLFKRFADLFFNKVRECVVDGDE